MDTASSDKVRIGGRNSSISLRAGWSFFMGCVPGIAQTTGVNLSSSGVFCQALAAKKRMDAGGVFGQPGIK